MTPKIVMFNMELGDAPSEDETADREEPSHNKLETMIKELSHALTGNMKIHFEKKNQLFSRKKPHNLFFHVTYIYLTYFVVVFLQVSNMNKNTCQ